VKRPLVALACIAAAVAVQAQPYKNPNLPVEDRIRDLLHRMTTEEKIAQLRSDSDEKVYMSAITTTGFGFMPIYKWRGKTPAELAAQINETQKLALQSRLSIPVMIYEEALHGLIDNGHTSFPQAIALAATWDPALIHQCATAIANETNSEGIHQVLSPVINVDRDARWGRMEESYGEDPLLTAQIAVAFVSAFEKNGVATTPKHFVANLWDGGRDSNSVHISERQLRDIYMEPFRACFQEGGSRSVMCSYNAVNGIPCACDPWLLSKVLRNEWGFKGYVVSDWGAAGNVIDDFHVVSTQEQAAAALLNAGMDSEAPGVYIFGKPLEDAVHNGLISQRVLDESVSRVLRVKFEKGLFDHPMVDPNMAAQLAVDPSHTALAKEAARRAMVLLKNDRNALPLSKDLKRVTVFGDLANGQIPLGGYSGTGNREVRKSILQGLKNEAPSTQFQFVEGCSIGAGAVLPAIPTIALETPGGGPGLKGEYYANQNFEGAPALTRIDKTVDFDWGDDAPDKSLPIDHFSVRWTGFVIAPQTGTYAISGTSDDGMRIWLNNSLLVDNWGDHGSQSVLGHAYLQKGQRVPIKIEYYENSGEAVAKLGWQLQGAPDTFLDRVRSASANSDATLIFAGIREGEGQDRAYLKLPGNQEDVIEAAAAIGKPVIVVLVAGAPVTMEGWVDHVPAILDAWYPGQEGADAIAETVFGDNNPSGKLPMTFPKTVGQCPLYYNFEASGRGYDYVDSSGSPLFPFGHGLSYTKFEYSNLRIGPPTTVTFAGTKAGTFSGVVYPVSVDVTNAGSRSGTEVVQLYIHQQVASVLRSLKELKGFQAVQLAPGETKTVTFNLGFKELSMYNSKMQRVVEPGNFDILVGSSSGDIRQKGILNIAK